MPSTADLTNNSPQWATTLNPRLKSQMEFLIAIDALKSVNRASRIASNDRRENSAEHSWHLTLFAQVLAEYADTPVNVDRVIHMLMVHDIVEIDAGDVPLHGKQDPDTHAREQAAATRLFGLLPVDQGALMRQCWDEFEAAESADARFAKAVDRLQPIVLNMLTNGGTWKDFNVSLDQVTERTSQIAAGSETLWSMVETMFSEAASLGWLKTDQPADLS